MPLASSSVQTIKVILANFKPNMYFGSTYGQFIENKHFFNKPPQISVLKLYKKWLKRY